MSLTIEQQTRLIDHFFDNLHPEICKDDFNVALISNFIREKTAGLDKMNRAALEWAVSDLAGKLHYYQRADVSAQLAAGADAQRQLAAELAEKNRKAEELRLQIERQSRQDARQPGVSSAFSKPDDVEQEQRSEAERRQQEAARQLRYREFRKELSDIEVYLITDSQGRIRHGATSDYKKSAKARLRLKYREFATEVHD
jgi:hypothetical protein